MTAFPTTPDAVDLAGRYAARACVRSFDANPMMWRDVGAMLVAALLAPDATAAKVLAMGAQGREVEAGAGSGGFDVVRRLDKPRALSGAI